MKPHYSNKQTLQDKVKLSPLEKKIRKKPIPGQYTTYKKGNIHNEVCNDGRRNMFNLSVALCIAVNSQTARRCHQPV